MALFDTPPKSDPRFLYGREKELSQLVDHLKNKDWVILLGTRRIGKTSLASCAINKLSYKSVIIDARQGKNFAMALVSSLLKRSESTLKVKADANVHGMPLSLGVEYTKRLLNEDLDMLLKKKGRVVILVDEVQWFRNPRSVGMLLAHIYDFHYDKVSFVITGSAIGTAKAILEPGPRSALYGRAISKMEVARWSPQVSIDFIKEGCKEKKLYWDETLSLEAEKRLGGIPGWLTLFGYNYARSENLEAAFRSTTKEAFRIIADELESIGKSGIGSEKQIEILKILAKSPERFMEISSDTGFNDATLSRNLDTLSRLGYIEKNKEGNYAISDPVLKAYVSENLIDKAFGVAKGANPFTRENVDRV